MLNDLDYSSSLNGATFLLFELKQLLNLKLEGLSNNEIRNKVREKNIFQFNHQGRITRTLPSLMRRVKVLDLTLCQLFIESPVEVSKTINLYANMKPDLLFYEFMDVVIREKFAANN